MQRQSRVSIWTQSVRCQDVDNPLQGVRCTVNPDCRQIHVIALPLSVCTKKGQNISVTTQKTLHTH